MNYTKSHLYNGVTIHEIDFCGKPYFYPSFNGDIEFTSLQSIKDWIDGPYKFAMEQCKWLAEQMGVSVEGVFGFMNNLAH